MRGWELDDFQVAHVGRRRIFISHAFRRVGDYAALLNRLSVHNYDIYNHSIPYWNPADAEARELAEAIDRKMRGCDAVLVLVTPGIHKSTWIDYELKLARHYDKRVIGVWRHGEKTTVPIPEVLDKQVYRMVGWNGPVLIRAIEGDYPADTRVFDIAEVVDKERLARNLIAGASIGLLVLIGTRDTWMRWLNRRLASSGITLRLEPVPDGPGVAGPAIMGGLLGALLSALTKKPSTNVVAMTAAGAAVGGSIGLVTSYRMHITRSSTTRVIGVSFETDT